MARIWFATALRPPGWTSPSSRCCGFLSSFPLGQQWVPKPARSTLHLAAYGVSILLGLSIFLLFRRLAGMKYNLPRSGRDFVNLLLGFAACAPILIALGRAIGFLPPFHWPAQPSGGAHWIRSI